MEVLFNFDTEDKRINELGFNIEDLIKDVVFGTVIFEKFTSNVEVSVSVVDNEEIRELNKKYRQKDSVTDVLSFPLYSELPLEIDSDEIIALGDIVISLDKAFKQAKEYGHSVKREIAFLTAHSMLHLLGYDHMNENDEEVMLRKQKKILESLDIRR
ncbi:MAG: rRNA maturation RNase YbeY [Lachnospirales bacterium]